MTWNNQSAVIADPEQVILESASLQKTRLHVAHLHA